MFGEAEFKEAMRAHKSETSPRAGGDAFTSLRRKNVFFMDLKDKEGIDEQARLFIGIVSNMDRDNYTKRYVLQTFLLDFCRFLDKDFLFNITDGKTFFSIKDDLKEFTGEIYEANSKFTQNVGLHSLEHLIQDYGALLKYVDKEEIKREDEIQPPPSSEPTGGFGNFFEGGKLW